MAKGARTTFRSILWGIALAIFSLGGLLVVAGILCQRIATYRDLNRYPPPGRVFEVDGLRLHVIEHGDDGPVVVFDSAVGMSSLSWSLVEPEVAGFTRTFAWDRPGYGWSDPGPRPQDSAMLVELLHELLQIAGEPGPCVLVGSSFGGANVRLFAFRYPEQVAGLVLVDPAHEDQFDRTPAPPRPTVEGMWVYQIKTRLGLMRLSNMPYGVAGMNVLSPELQESARAVGFRTSVIDAIVAETAAIGPSFEDVRQARAGAGPHPLGNRPVVVLTHQDPVPLEGEEAGFYASWVALHEELAAESTRGRHVIVPESGHFIAVEQPSSVVSAIRDVVEIVRSDSEGQKAP